MARSYGHIMSAIWNDPDFRALDGSAQRVYLMLVTQANISSAGTLELTVRRWASYATDTTSDGLSECLSVLAEARFIVVDWDTEELLVRKFVKWDGGYGNEKRRPAITAAANTASSRRVRTALAIELDALSVPHALSDTPRVVVTEVELDPQPATPNPESAALALVAEPATTAQTIIGAWLEWCSSRPPKQVVGQIAKLVGEMLAEGIDPEHIRRGLAAWTTKGLHPSVLPSMVNEVMNAPPKTAGGKPDVWLGSLPRLTGVNQ